MKGIRDAYLVKIVAETEKMAFADRRCQWLSGGETKVIGQGFE